MVQINFQKVLKQKGVLTLVRQIFPTLESSVCILSKDGKILLGREMTEQTQKYPVELSGEVFGWVVGNESACAISSLLSYIIKQEFAKKSLAIELLDRYQEIDLFFELSTQITASLNLQEIAQLAIEKIETLIDCSAGSILLVDQQTNELNSLCEFGQFGHLKSLLKLEEDPINQIINQGSGEIVNDLCSLGSGVDSQESICSVICVPLKTEEEVIGAIVIGSDNNVTYTTEDLKILNIFASQVAIAIEKALLYQQSLNAAECAKNQAQELQRTLGELQETQAQLVQSAKMSSLGEMIAGIAHEINNPVNFIHGNLNHAWNYSQDLLDLLALYQQYYPQPVPEIQEQAEEIDLDFLISDMTQLLSSMRFGVNRIKDIVYSLRNFSRLDEAERKPVNIHEGINSTLMILRHRLQGSTEHPEIEVIKDYGELPLVECYAGQLNQVFMNIISNAIDAFEEKGKNPQIRISTQVLDDDWVEISIVDNGVGIPEEVKQRIYDPFFTTKEVGKGTGLGMAISYQIVVEKHGGVLKCLSQPGEGTEFWIQIPIMPLGEGSRTCCYDSWLQKPLK
ncbi:MAG: ATP-binding protein [Nostocaceae cyanobacterium]|nr:ATP-binding protein [Nostocaceae cyanobacterium]